MAKRYTTGDIEYLLLFGSTILSVLLDRPAAVTAAFVTGTLVLSAVRKMIRDLRKERAAGGFADPCEHFWLDHGPDMKLKCIHCDAETEKTRKEIARG